MMVCNDSNEFSFSLKKLLVFLQAYIIAKTKIDFLILNYRYCLKAPGLQMIVSILVITHTR